MSNNLLYDSMLRLNGLTALRYGDGGCVVASLRRKCGVRSSVLLCYMSASRDIRLSGNRLSGRIVDLSSSLLRLTRFDVSWNAMSGSFPTQLACLASMR